MMLSKRARHPRGGACRHRRHLRPGFTLVEVAVAAVLLMIAVGGLASSVVAAVELGRANEETALADEAARRMAQTVQAGDFATIFATWNDASFDVAGLDVRPGDPDGSVGRILFPTIAGALREDVVDPSIGMPRDLNGDGVLDALDHANDYALLPVTVRVEWTGVSGDRMYEIDTLLIP